MLVLCSVLVIVCGIVFELNISMLCGFGLVILS